MSCSKFKHPTDDELINNFNATKELFTKMIKMIEIDTNLKRVDDNWTSPDDHSSIGISKKRISEYRKLFIKCNVPRGFSAFHKEEEIQFIASCFGLATGGSCKGYVYKKVKPPETEIVSSIDDYIPKNSRSYRIYLHIEDNWYLFYDYDD